MFTFLDMLAIVVFESSFGAYVCPRRPVGLHPGVEKSGRIVAFHVDLTLALTRCSCSALREVAVFVRECGKCKPLYASVIERCVTLPVGTWSVARKQSFASTAVT